MGRYLLWGGYVIAFLEVSDDEVKLLYTNFSMSPPVIMLYVYNIREDRLLINDSDWCAIHTDYDGCVNYYLNSMEEIIKSLEVVAGDE